jgi:secreted trypsin-like serine protease
VRLFYFFWIIIMPIVGFTKSDEWDEFNSSLLIEVTRPTGVFTCTGVAVSNDLVITAAHCLEGKITKVRVFTQSFYDPKSNYIEVKSFKIHPKYQPKNSRYLSDVAKIHLSSSLPASIKILPIFKETIVWGDIYRFGFGERNKKNVRTVITPKLRRMNLDENIVELNDTFSYSGDSGGPIYLKRGKETFLLAIHSTLSFGPEGKFSYNPLLAHYASWIFLN